MVEPGRVELRRVTPCISKAWWFHICFRFRSMTTRLDAIKKRNCTWLCKIYNQVVINQQGVLALNVLYAVEKDQIKLFKGKCNKSLKPKNRKQLQQKTTTTTTQTVMAYLIRPDACYFVQSVRCCTYCVVYVISNHVANCLHEQWNWSLKVAFV